MVSFQKRGLGYSQIRRNQNINSFHATVPFLYITGIERDHWHETGSIGFRCWKLIFLQKGQLTEVTGLTKHLFSVKNEEWNL